MRARQLLGAAGRIGIVVAGTAVTSYCAPAPLGNAPSRNFHGRHIPGLDSSHSGDWAAHCERNRYGDVVIKLSDDGIAACSCNSALAAGALDAVIRSAVHQTTRGCMVSVRGPDAAKVLVPIALAHGFHFHRADKEGLTMRFFKSGCEAEVKHGGDPMPEAAFTSVATSGVVINKHGEVLLIRQTYDPKAEWRLPGGATDRDESLMGGARREVLEETGQHVELLGVLGVRQAPRYATVFGRAFIGATGLFRLKSDGSGGEDAERPRLRWPSDEIIDACWMSIAHALRPPIGEGEDRAESASGIGVKEFEAGIGQARAASDAVEGGMTSSQFQRACVLRGAVIQGFGHLVPSAAVDDAVAFGSLTPEQGLAIVRGRGGAGIQLLREASEHDSRRDTGTASAQTQWVMLWP